MMQITEIINAFKAIWESRPSNNYPLTITVGAKDYDMCKTLAESELYGFKMKDKSVFYEEAKVVIIGYA